MLLSGDAGPIFDLDGLTVVPTAAAVVSISANAPASSVAAWISAEPQGPLWIAPRALGEPWAPIAPESLEVPEVGGPLIDPENAAQPADIPDLMPPLDPDDESEGQIFEDFDGIPTIPWVADHTVKGSFDASRAQVAYKVPIGPKTDSLRLFLGPAPDGSEVSPVIASLLLVDPEGHVLARISTVSDGGYLGNGQHLLVMLPDAPEGSELVIHLAVYGAQPEGGPGTGGGGGEVGPIDFLFNIQRDDPEPPQTMEEPSPPSTLPAPPIGAPPPPVVGFGANWRPLQAMDPIVAGLIRMQTSRSGAGGGRSVSKTQSQFNGVVASTVYLGPLVSRGGAPLGPTLATSVDEPTPVIDREGLTVDEAIDRIESELDAGLLATIKRREDSGLGRDGALDGRMTPPLETPEAPLTAIPGPGGLPVLVSRMDRSRARDEAGELTAHLQSRSVEEALTAEAPNPPPMADQIAGGVEAELANAGLATRAAGLIVGLGLATGPLYPDLVALAKKKLSRGKRPAGRRRPFRGGRPNP